MFNCKRKYLVLIPVIFLIFNAMYYKNATRGTENTLLHEKYIEVITKVDMLAAGVEANTERAWYDHEHNIIASVEYLDKLYQVYAGVFKVVDGEYILITERFYETSPFEPFDYPEFEEMARDNDFGSIVINYAPEDQTYRDLHVYFRWMPLYSDNNEKYLVVAGVSQYSIVSQIPYWVSAGQWVSTIVTFVLNLVLVIMIVRLGHIRDMRKGDKYWNGGGNSV